MTYDYFLKNFGRNSFDGNGAKIRSYIHYRSNYVNAFWNGYVMTYGDGNGSSWYPLTSVDICGHEVTHAVTTNSAGLIYRYESGALNESFSDIFGNAIEFYADSTQFDWGMGEDITSSGRGLRNMAKPNDFRDRSPLSALATTLKYIWSPRSLEEIGLVDFQVLFPIFSIVRLLSNEKLLTFHNTFTSDNVWSDSMMEVIYWSTPSFGKSSVGVLEILVWVIDGKLFLPTSVYSHKPRPHVAALSVLLP